METEITLAYDGEKHRAVLTFPNGRTLAVGNVTEEQATAFKERHAPEFMKRDCCLHTVEGAFTRDSSPQFFARNAKFKEGDKVKSLVNHMPGMKGMSGTIKIVRTAPPYYGVQMEGESTIHKWLAEDEIEVAT